MASAMVLVSGLATDTFALTGTTNSKIYKNWILMDNAGNTHGVEGHLFVDDTEVYCVDFYTDFHSRKTVTEGTYTDWYYVKISDNLNVRIICSSPLIT